MIISGEFGIVKAFLPKEIRVLAVLFSLADPKLPTAFYFIIQYQFTFLVSVSNTDSASSQKSRYARYVLMPNITVSR